MGIQILIREGTEGSDLTFFVDWSDNIFISLQQNTWQNQWLYFENTQFQ